MYDSFEQKFFDALLRQLLTPEVDNQGNIRRSLLTEAITTWAYEQKDKIAKEVIKKLDIKKLAETIADRVFDSLTNDWEGERQLKKIKKEVLNKLADKIVETKFKKIDSKKIKKALSKR